MEKIIIMAGLTSCLIQASQETALVQAPKKQVLACGRLSQYIPIPDIQDIILGYLDTWEEVQKLSQGAPGERSWDVNVKFALNSPYMVSGSGGDRNLNVWQKNNNKFSWVQTLKGQDDKVHSVAFSPDGKFVASAHFDRTLKLWHKHNNKFELVQTLVKMPDLETIYSIVFSFDSNYLASTHGFTVNIWNRQNNQFKLAQTLNAQTLKGKPVQVMIYDVAFSRDGNYVASGDAYGIITVWQKKNNKFELMQIPESERTDGIRALAFPPEGESLASAFADGTIKTWKLKNNQFELAETLKLDGEDCVTHLEFSPCGRSLASVNFFRLKIWQKNNNKFELTQTLRDGYVTISSVSFAPDGGYIAAGVGDRIIIWKNQARELLLPSDLVAKKSSNCCVIL